MPVVNQVERHPRLNQKPLIEYDHQHGIVTQAWSPLGRGTILTNPILEKIAKKHGKNHPPKSSFVGTCKAE